MDFRYIRILAISIAMLLSTVASYAQLTVQDTLSAFGYPSDQWEIVLSWEEASRLGEAQLVQAARVTPVSGGEGIDLYWNSQGELLELADLLQMGIQPKDWSPKTLNKASERSFGFPKFQKEKPTPKSFSEKIKPKEYVVLPEVSGLDKSEDLSFEKAPYKIGDFTALSQTVLVQGLNATDGAWSELADGSLLWGLTFRSPGVTGQRLHFSALNIPAGVQVLIYNADKPTEVYGPLLSGNDYLAPSCFGEGVTIEVLAPPSANLDDLYFEVDEILHITKAFETAVLKAGTCNNDSSCFNEWAETAAGVGLITFAGSLCTCSLIVDDDPNSATPYILTANHCINTQSAADTVEVFWLFQTDVCNGTVPLLSDVPRTTGGANFLVGSSSTNGTDVTLLRLNSIAPNGIPFLGFATGGIPVGTEAVCIHHPRGEFKRLSFGDITDQGSPGEGGTRLQPASRFHEVLWFDGTTEPGSSGSPLFLSSTHQIIGQLWGGRASCSSTNEPDYYGRFDVSFSLLEPYLGTPSSPFDLDKNGVVNSIDMQLTINAALGKNTTVTADFDENGKTDAVDVQFIINAILVGGG